MPGEIHPIDRLVGQRVRLARLARGLSQTKLASSLGVTFQQLQKYEKGTNRISASKLFEIARTLDIEIGSFFRDSTDEPNDQPIEQRDWEPLDRIDALIVRKLCKLRDTEVKRRIYGVIDALVDQAPAAAEFAEGKRQ